MPDSTTTYETVRYELDDAVATITMDRSDRRNALNRALERDLLATLQRAAADDAVRAVVLTGAGKDFCSGADLASFGPSLSGEQARDHLLSAYWPLVELLVAMPKPTVAAVNGTAAGAGCSLALACDLAVMADDAALLQAFSNIGLVPDAGSSWFLARHLGYRRAYAIIAEGRPVPAARCQALGLVNRVVPPGDLLRETRAWATDLALRPTLALGLSKQALQAALTSTLEATVHLEGDLQARCVESADHAEGVRAFLEKRLPVFRGR